MDFPSPAHPVGVGMTLRMGTEVIFSSQAGIFLSLPLSLIRLTPLVAEKESGNMKEKQHILRGEISGISCLKELTIFPGGLDLTCHTCRGCFQLQLGLQLLLFPLEVFQVLTISIPWGLQLKLGLHRP